MTKRAARRVSRVRLEVLSREREAEFLVCVRKSRKLHRPWLKAPATREQFRDFLKRQRGERQISFFICASESAELIGVVNLSEIVRGLFQSAYLSYYAFEPFAGQGLMREGLALVLDRAFGELALHRLEANVQPRNRRSRRLVEGLGFRLEGFSPCYLKIGGRWRDHERWAILREEWPKPRARRAAQR
ncbi:MAG TPA: GNAT family N-acetyltransferase [Polyangiaceae bacterium]|jgi:ribosomal-protein-alanine N-acetyltransferase|nr:GNAT family N-acetyltransferase [Polyangiaceae bacterium]